MYAGLTLAQLAVIAGTDPAGVQAELQARVARNGKSAKNAQKALDRMAAGESVAIPAPAPKAPKASAPAARTTTARKVTNPNLPIVAANARAKGVVSERQAFALVAAIGRDAGYSIPRWITAGSKGRTIARKA